MFGEKKNLKDLKNDSIKDISSVPAPYGAGGSHSGSVIGYSKTNKLITALYMVTDIMDASEPLRNKLRTLGVEIISDTHSVQQNNIGHLASILHSKISQVMSFLELASTINIISEMNYRILKREFLELSQSIKESTGKTGISDRKIDLSEFFTEELPAPQQFADEHSPKGHPIGHQRFTRIGVQKGSTLLKAIKDMSDRNNFITEARPQGLHVNDFDILKKQRREDIINIIKLAGGSATIKDIKDKIKTAIGQASSLVSCGEKTLQRELVSMVRDGVLNKTGEKRWSRYFIK